MKRIRRNTYTGKKRHLPNSIVWWWRFQKNVSTTDPALRGREMTVKGSNGKPKRTITLKGEFIVGIISDSDPNTIIWNPSFDSQKVKEFGNQREQEIKEEEAKRKEAEEARQAQTENVEPAKLGWFKRLFGGAKK